MTPHDTPIGVDTAPLDEHELAGAEDALERRHRATSCRVMDGPAILAAGPQTRWHGGVQPTSDDAR
jgi:hypothetical protein